MMTALISSPHTPAEGSEGARSSWQAANQVSFDDRDLQQELRCDLGPGEAVGCDLFDAAVQISPIDSVKRHSAGWQGLLTESIYAPAGSKIELRFEGPVHLLVMYDEGARREGETLIEGLDASRLRNFADKLTFVPAGHGYYERHETSAATRMSFIYLDPAKLQKLGFVEGTYVPKVFFDDAVLWRTAAKLRGVIETGQAGGILYTEALAAVLAHELPRSDQHSGRTAPVSRGGLTSWQMRAVTGYIEGHISEQIFLDTLARLARLSQHHFCRAFKRSFGLSPHQYHIQRRIQRAKALLADRANSVTHVALILGYSQASAFSLAFRKTTGRTPREFRRDFG